MEYVTTEHGEAMARRRKCMVIFLKGKVVEGWEGRLLCEVVPPYGNAERAERQGLEGSGLDSA